MVGAQTGHPSGVSGEREVDDATLGDLGTRADLRRNCVEIGAAVPACTPVCVSLSRDGYTCASTSRLRG